MSASTRKICIQQTLNIRRDLRIGYRDYAQVQVPAGNNEHKAMASRIEGAMAVWPAGNLHGRLKFFAPSHQIVIRDTPPLVVEYLNIIAEKYSITRDPQFIVGDKALDVDREDTVLDLTAASTVDGGPLRNVLIRMTWPLRERFGATATTLINVANDATPTVESATHGHADNTAGAPDHNNCAMHAVLQEQSSSESKDFFLEISNLGVTVCKRKKKTGT